MYIHKKRKGEEKKIVKPLELRYYARRGLDAYDICSLLI